MVASNLNQGATVAVETLEPMTEIVLDMMRASLALFNSGGRRGGGSWKRLKEDTIRRKGSEIILVKTGDLKRSLTEPGAPYQIVNITRDTVEFGTDHPWAEVHHKGTKDGRIPARPIIKFTARDDTKWVNIITTHMMKPFMAAE